MYIVAHFNPRIVRKRCDSFRYCMNSDTRYFNPRIVRKRCDLTCRFSPTLLITFQSTHRTQTMRLFPIAVIAPIVDHFNPRIVRKRCDGCSRQSAMETRLSISIHASYANDATKSSIICMSIFRFQSTHRTQTMRPAVFRFGSGIWTFQSTHRTQTMRLQIRNKNIEYSFLFNNLINSLNLTCDISLNLA